MANKNGYEREAAKASYAKKVPKATRTNNKREEPWIPPSTGAGQAPPYIVGHMKDIPIWSSEPAVPTQPLTDDQITEKNMGILNSWGSDDRQGVLDWLTYRPGGAWNIGKAMESWASGINGPTYQDMMTQARASAAYQDVGEKHGEDVTARVAESADRAQNRQLHEDVTQAAGEMAEGGSTAHDIFSVLAQNLGSYMAPLGFLSGKSLETGQYAGADPYNWANIPGAYAAAVRAEGNEHAGENLANAVGNVLGFNYADIQGTKAGNAFDTVGRLGYQGIMTWADSALRAAQGAAWGSSLGIDPEAAKKAAKVFGSSLAAMGTFGQSYSEYSQSGIGKKEAGLQAFTDAAAEFVSEYLQTDRWFKVAEGANLPAKEIVKNFFKNMGAEIAEEEISLIVQKLSQLAILGENADWRKAAADYQAQGMNPMQAMRQVMWDFGGEMAETAGVSIVSSVLGSGGATIAGVRAANRNQAQQGQQGQQPAYQVGQQVRAHDQNRIGEIVAVDPETGAYSVRFERKDGTVHTIDYKNGEFTPVGTVEAAEAPAAAQPEAPAQTPAEAPAQTPTQTPAQTAADSPAVAEALEGYRQNNRVSNNQATAILADKEAVAMLTAQTGMELPGTASGNRAAVKAAVAQLAQTQTQEAEAEAQTAKTPEAAPAPAQEAPEAAEETEAAETQGEVTPAAEAVESPVAQQEAVNPLDRAIGAALRNERPSAYQVGQRVRAHDRNNIGKIVAVDPETGTYSVRFESKDGAVQTVDFKKGQFTPVGTVKAAKNQAEARIAAQRKENSDAIGAALAKAKRTQRADSSNVSPGGAQKVSGVYANSYRNAVDPEIQAVGRAVLENDPKAALYTPTTEAKTTGEADARTSTPEKIVGEYDTLMGKDAWTAADNDTAFRVVKQLARDGDKERYDKLVRKQREIGTQAGQVLQSFAKYSRENTQAAVDDAAKNLMRMQPKDVPRKYWRNAAGKGASTAEAFETWRSNVMETLQEIGMRIDAVDENDPEGMRQIVRELAQFRRTTKWLGYSNDLTRVADRGIKSLDYNTAKAIAKAQLAQIPNDFQRVSAAEAVKTVRIMNMLSALTTTNRNLAGNATMGIMDALSDSTTARAMDAIMSKFTGKRTVGDDVRHSGEYFRAAKKAAGMAALCVELGIPMETDGKYVGTARTFSPSGSILSRWMSAMEKGLAYSLEVTDRFFQGGTEGAVTASLEGLVGKGAISADDAQDIAANAGKRRTYKEGRGLARASVGMRNALNNISVGEGRNKVGIGDAVMPFASIPGEVAQVGMDYSLVGFTNGLRQMIDVVTKAQKGEEITAQQQRAAVTNFGRGVSGVAMTAIFAALAYAGAIKVHDEEDKDRNALEQSLGLSGAQLNLNAAWRALTGGDTAWRPDDIKIGLDFLEPFNAQMYIGYGLSLEDDFASAVKSLPGATVAGIAESILDIPMMQGMSDMVDLVQSFGEVDEDPDAVKNAAGQAVGNLISGAVPSWLRQTAQYIDPYYRDTTGATALEKAANQFIASIPFAGQNLPVKYDGLGNPQMRYTDPVLGFFNTFLSPGEVTGQTAPGNAYEISEYLGQLAETLGSEKAYPDAKPPKSFSVDGETYTLNTAQQSRYQRVYGENVTAFYGELLENDAFLDLPPELQEAVLLRAKSQADTYAKNSVMGQDGVTRSADPADTANGFIRAELGSYMGGAFADITAGNRADGFEKLSAGWDIYQSLDQRGRDRFLADNGGRVEYYIHAREAGMSTGTFGNLYTQYRGIDGQDISISQKANAWANTLQKEVEAGNITADQAAVLKKDMVFRYSGIVETTNYDAMVSAGLNADSAHGVTNLLAGLEPEPGKTTVRDVQNAEAIAGMDMDEKSTVAAMHVYLSDAQDKNLDQMIGMGYSPEDYAAVWRIYLDTTGTGKKNRVIEAIMRELGIRDYSTAAAVYNIYAK